MNLKNLLLASILLSCLQLQASDKKAEEYTSETISFESNIKAKNTALNMMWLTARLTGLYGCLSGLAGMPAAPWTSSKLPLAMVFLQAFLLNFLV